MSGGGAKGDFELRCLYNRGVRPKILCGTSVGSVNAPNRLDLRLAHRDHTNSRKLEFPFTDLGEQTLKNIAQPIDVFRILAQPEAPAKLFPPLSDKPFTARTEEERR